MFSCQISHRADTTESGATERVDEQRTRQDLPTSRGSGRLERSGRSVWGAVRLSLLPSSRARSGASASLHLLPRATELR